MVFASLVAPWERNNWPPTGRPRDYLQGVSAMFGGQGGAPAVDPTMLDAMLNTGAMAAPRASWPPSGRPMDAALRSPAPMLDARDYPGYTGPPASVLMPEQPGIPTSAIDSAREDDLRRTLLARFRHLSSPGDTPFADAITAQVAPGATEAQGIRDRVRQGQTTYLGGLLVQAGAPPAMSALDRERALSARMANHVFGGNTVARQDASGRPYFLDASAAGNTGRQTMTPDAAMRAMEMRTPGTYDEAIGAYIPAALLGTPSSQAGPGSVTSESTLRRMLQGSPGVRAQVSDKRQADLAARESARRERGMNRVRGGYIPPDGAQSMMLAAAMQRNPEAVMRLMGQVQATEAEKRNAALTFLAAREQNASRAGQVQDALKAQNFQAMLESGVDPQQAMQYAGMGAQGAAGMQPASPTSLATLPTTTRQQLAAAGGNDQAMQQVLIGAGVADPNVRQQIIDEVKPPTDPYSPYELLGPILSAPLYYGGSLVQNRWPSGLSQLFGGGT